jgi:hypothetical protein
MQSSVRSLTPRLVDIGRKNSNTSIKIDQEITVVSSRRDGFKETGQGQASYPIESSTNGHARQSSRGTTATVTASQSNRWNPESSVPHASRAYSMREPRHVLHRQESRDASVLDSNRESMKALTDFLKTKVICKILLQTKQYIVTDLV